ncbi:MAG: hypothetical protein Q7T82_10325 [Armatimonadota bacterium]|nr:hypothetical protein [Armatimonadota bacterium]
MSRGNVLRRLFTVTAVIVTLAIVSGLAYATPWLSESFDGYTAGSLAGQGTWTGDSLPVQVETTFVKSGKSVEMDCHWSGVSGGVSRTVSSGPGYHYVEMDAAMDTEGGAPVGDHIGYVMIFNSTGEELTRVYYANKQLKVLIGPDPGTQYVIADSVANRQWYHVTLGINLASGRFDAWVDGQQRLTNGILYNSGSSIGRITVGEWAYTCDLFTKSELYVDNLTGNLQTALPPGVGSCILAPRFFPGYQQQNVCFPFVLRETANSYRMYYTGTGTCQWNDSAWDQWMTGMVTSTDTVTWKFPDEYEAVLYPHKFMEGEALNTDATSAEFDSGFAFGACVIKDGSTYKTWYTGWNGDTDYSGATSTKVNFRIGYATSGDGITWTKYSGSAGAGSVLGTGPPGQQDTKGVGQPYVIKDGSTYRMWHEGFDGTAWRIFAATSADGVNWTRQGIAVNLGGSGARDQYGCRNPVVISRNGGYELWYQGQTSSNPNYRILRATSSNMLSWAKVTGEVTLNPVAPPKRGWLGEPNWDISASSAMIHVDSILVTDGSCQVFYAKQATQVWPRTYGTFRERAYHIYTEVVNP